MKEKEGKREGENVVLTVKTHARNCPGRENKINRRTPILPPPLKPNQSKRKTIKTYTYEKERKKKG